MQPISLILLVHQEAEVIESIVRDFYEKVISRIPGSEFLVFEDGSTDGTKDILRRIKKQYNLTLEMGNAKKGYTRAMKEAFMRAKNPIIFFSDSDGQHDPNDFWSMYTLMDKHDMVIGWKKDRQDGIFRQILTKAYNTLLGIYFGVRLHDIDCGFRIMKKEVVDFLLTSPWNLKHCISSELTVKAWNKGFNITESPVHHYSRQFGESRGLPLHKLPSIIFHIMRQFPKIKRDIRSVI